MFGFMLFLHFTGLIFWLGTLFAIVVMLTMLKKQLGSPETRQLAKKVVRAFSWLVYPSSLIVLISGVFMLIEMGLGKGEKPLWLEIMEKGGGTIIILALVLTAIMNGKVKKKLSAIQAQTVNLSGYLTTMTSFIVVIFAIIFVVSLKI